MTTAALTQAVILGLVALFALGFAVRRLLPGTSTRALAGIADWLDAPGRPRLVHRFGQWLRPARAGGSGCGSGDGCGSCGSCATAPKPAGETQPLVFTRKPKPAGAGDGDSRR